MGLNALVAENKMEQTQHEFGLVAVRKLDARTLIIIRGLPGAGKSTLASVLMNDTKRYVHLETDMYWYRNPNREYNFVFEELNRAHRWCLQTAEAFMANGLNIIQSNTNLVYSEVKNYVEFAKACEMHIMVYTLNKDKNFGSIHNVPKEVMDRMYNKMESHETFMEKLRAHYYE